MSDLRQAPVFTTDGPADWHRVHPISPLVRGWIAVVAVMFVFGRNSLEGAFGGRNGFDPSRAPVAIILLVLAAAVVVFGLSFFLSWRFTRYQVTDTHVHINSGVIFRQQRRANIDRVQAIDVVQPLLARVFGLAELKFEVADGGKSAMKLSFLKLDEAKRLRAAILARAAGVVVDPADPHHIQEAAEQPILAVSPGRVIGSVLFSSMSAVFGLIFIGIVVAIQWTGQLGILVALIPLFLGMGASYFKRITEDMNFKVAQSPDGVRLHYGMLETRSQTIPPGRVQAVGIHQGPIWRFFGWYRVQVNVAGYGTGGQEGGNRTVVLPVGKIAEVMDVLALVFPDPGVENPFEVFAAGLQGPGNKAGFTHSPRQAIWIDPIAWRYNAYRATTTALLTRKGFFSRHLDVVPHERTQSLSLHQGPLMRALGVVDFELHSTVGPIRPVVRHMALAAGRALFDEQAARAATARRIHAEGPWAKPPTLADEPGEPADPLEAINKESHHGD